MKIREDYPIYINPDFIEILQLAEQKWKTIRILSSDNYLILGSGYGNTHQSLANARKTILTNIELRKESFVPFILYHEDGVALFNLEDCSGPSRARFSEAKDFFNKEQYETLKDLIRESDLSL